MECPKCGYVMDAFTVDCPRCKHFEEKGMKPTPFKNVIEPTTPLSQVDSTPIESTQYIDSEKVPIQRKKKWRFILVILVILIVSAVIFSLNYFLLDRPVQKALNDDSRNSGCSLHAHYRYYINPNILVLDLRNVSQLAPIDLFRMLFQSADALYNEGRRFDRVILAKNGTPVFMMKGDDFSTLGSEFGAGQNPVYLLRTLPEKLYTPNGEPAFEHWEGGWLGVLGKQMEDVNQAARRWIGSD